jgi:hypothetical protein
MDPVSKNLTEGGGITITAGYSLCGIGRHFIPNCTHLIVFEVVISKGFLGLLRVHGLRSISFWSDNKPVDEQDRLQITKFKSALSIMRRHLNHGRDILTCQEELIEAGLKEFATL